jgi:RNA polymerase sigma-70 factor, ECF subfamily
VNLHLIRHPNPLRQMPPGIDTRHVVGERFAEVLASAQSGDEAAFAVLWRDGNPALLRYLRAMTPESAEDVAAETWVQIVRGLGKFRGEEQDWRAWLFTTARRRMLDQARLRRRHPTEPLDEVQASDEPRSVDTALLALENLATTRAIALVRRLPRQQADVILLRVVAGLDTDQVASLVGCSPGAVRVAAHRGLRRLATLLEEAGVTL